MKPKNLILGLFAIVFAVGSAFVTWEKSINTPYIWVKQRFNSSVFVCTSAPGECVTSGNLLCKVSIVMENGITKTAEAHNAVNCFNTYEESDLTPVIDLGGTDRPFAVSDDGVNPL
jgi:hypothetical protein